MLACADHLDAVLYAFNDAAGTLITHVDFNPVKASAVIVGGVALGQINSLHALKPPKPFDAMLTTLIPSVNFVQNVFFSKWRMSP